MTDCNHEAIKCMRCFRYLKGDPDESAGPRREVAGNQLELKFEVELEEEKTNECAWNIDMEPVL